MLLFVGENEPKLLALAAPTVLVTNIAFSDEVSPKFPQSRRFGAVVFKGNSS